MLHPLLAGVLLVNSICVAISVVKFLTLFILSHRVIWSASFSSLVIFLISVIYFTY